MDSDGTQVAPVDVANVIDVNLEERTEETASPVKQDAGTTSTAEVGMCSARKRFVCVLIPSSLAVVALVLMFVYGGILDRVLERTEGIHDEPLATLKGKHLGIATDVYIVDDSDAKNNGQNAMLAAIAGKAPYFHKWFGSSNSKAFHHDGGNPSSLQIAVAGTYEPQLQTNGCYEVHEWHPSGPLAQMSLSASMEVTHAHGVARMLVDQSKAGGQWNYVASFNFKKGAAQVTLSNRQSRCTGDSSCYTSFDAFRFVYVAPECNSQQNAHAAAKVAAGESAVSIVDSSNIVVPDTKPDVLANTAPQSEPSCMPAIIINDFDSHLVKSIVSPQANDLPEQGLEAFRPGRVGQKPFFHDWFGNILKKDFHHDAHINKGLLQVNYTSPLAKAGCYLLQEWHLGGNKYCVNYMPRRVPFHVHGVGSTHTAYADQSTNGGQWNTLGLYQFSTSATIVMDNSGTNDCLYQGACYTVFDSIRLVHAGDDCKEVDHSEDALSQMSDLACDESNSLAQLRTVPGQNEAEPSTAEVSPAKLLEITSPNEKTVVAPAESINVFWQTEGVASGTDFKISLLYNNEILADAHHRSSAASEEMHLPIPNAQFIKTYSNAAAGGNDKFRVRIDVQHVVVDHSNGWSNQLYAFSPYFTIKM